jgi:small subunit ribosomal protein S9
MQNNNEKNEKIVRDKKSTGVQGLVSSIEVSVVEEVIVKATSKFDAIGRAEGTGRRKRSSAHVWLSSGDKITINNKKIEEYFPVAEMRISIMSPLLAVGMRSAKIFAAVRGGGPSGQAGAIRLAIARSLLNFDPSLKSVLKHGQFLTCDSRKKERKTPGFRTARKPQQFSKR